MITSAVNFKNKLKNNNKEIDDKIKDMKDKIDEMNEQQLKKLMK